MPKNLREILADAAAANDTAFEIGGEKFTLADLRGLNTADHQALSAKVADAERIGKEAQGLLEGLQAAMVAAEKNAPRKEEPVKTADWRKNPLYDELVPVIEALEATVKASASQSTALKASLDQSQAIYALERMRRQFAEAKVKPAGKTFEQVVTEVLQAKELDSMGLPTLEPYLHRSTEPDRIAEAVTAGVAKAQKEWEQKHKLDSVQKPGARFNVRAKGEAPIKKLDELTSELVANDPDIAAAAEGPIQ